jgi:uncharacterized caspase-like protein/WD40 repeat protein
MSFPASLRNRDFVFLCLAGLLAPALGIARADVQAIQASQLIGEMIANENNRDLDAQMRLYADGFTYQGEKVAPAEKRKSTASYYKRWPVAQWKLLEPVEITKQLGPDLYEARYVADFRVECPERRKWSQGTVTSLLTITNTSEGARILAARDKITKSSKGDLTGEKRGKTSDSAAIDQASAASSKAVDPVPVLQRERVAEPTFAAVDGKCVRLVYGNMQGWQVFDLVSRKVIAFGSSPNAASPYFGACFSPDGEVVVLVQGGNRSDPWLEAVPLSAPEQRIIVSLGETRSLGQVGISSEAVDGAIDVVDFSGGQKQSVKVSTTLGASERKKLPSLNVSVARNAVAWSTDGPHFISFTGRIVRVTKLTNLLSVLATTASGFELSPDQSTILIVNDADVSCYDVASGVKMWRAKVNKEELAFSKSGLLLTLAKDGILEVENVAGEEASEVTKISGLQGGSNLNGDERIVMSQLGNAALVGSDPAVLMGGFVSLIDIKRGQISWSIVDNNPKAPFGFSNDEKLVAVSRYGGFGSACADVYSAADGNLVYSIEFETPSYGLRALNLQKQVLYAAADDDKGVAEVRLQQSEGGEALKATRFFGPANRIDSISLSPDGATLLACDSEGFVNFWDIQSGKLTMRITSDQDGRPVLFTPKGEYAGVAGAFKQLGFRQGSRGFPFEQFDLRLNRPDIVLERLGAPAEAVAIAKQLREKRLKRMGVTEDMLKPDFHLPELEIVGDVPSTTDADEINVSIKASDTKYPLERLKVYVNNVPVNGRDGESLRDQNTQSLERTIPIKLAAGRNKIQVSVLNSAGAESLYANAEVNCTAKRPKPTLYAVALGVSDYANPDWNLKYAAKDARDVLERLKTRSGGSYGEVKELLLTDKQVTKESHGQIRDFLKDATIDDTVLMFVAGHGLLDSNYDYYFGTTDIDFNNPSENGIAFDEFDDLLARLPCLKKSLLIDTCHAGELDEEEKTLLASAGGVAAPLPTGSGIAMRSIGTRGMNVKAIEGARGASEWYDRLQGLFVDLRRGSGSTILSSSAGAEYALESSEQQNGLFTYAVLEALDGKKEVDTDKDGAIEMSELGEYVKKRVSELTNNKQTPNTRRVNLEGDFTLSKTE